MLLSVMRFAYHIRMNGQSLEGNEFLCHSGHWFFCISTDFDRLWQGDDIIICSESIRKNIFQEGKKPSNKKFMPYWIIEIAIRLQHLTWNFILISVSYNLHKSPSFSRALEYNLLCPTHHPWMLYYFIMYNRIRELKSMKSLYSNSSLGNLSFEGNDLKNHFFLWIECDFSSVVRSG